MRILPVALLFSLASASAMAEPVRYIVHFTDPAAAAVARRPLRATSARDVVPRHVRSVATGGEVFEVSDGNVAHLVALPGVVSVEEDVWLQPTAVTDPLWRRQWNLHDPRVGVDAEVAWRRTRGAGAVVAVLDTGITPHPEFDGQLLRGYDFVGDAQQARDGDGRDADPTDEGDWNDPGECGATSARRSSWHGTHVAGIVAARAGNLPGMIGLAPEAKLLPVRVLGRCGGRMSDVADAIVWASGGEVPGVPQVERRADVINLSLGVPGACSGTFSRAIDGARSRGSVVVAAAGNEEMPASAAMPANCPGVVTVGALARDGAMAWYSNFGDRVTLAAPGGSLTEVGADDIVSSVDGGQRGRERPAFAWKAGTSMAAPHVSALVALMRSVDPAIDVDAVTRQLVDNARPLPGPCPKGCGAGLMDAGATVDAVFEDRAPR
ncbi:MULTISPECIES: S8 family peptidase [unclassified Luteibacter]|uniref:S8 family peptidase n=1 Tax=unclassified Luteibacter TaxID=2620188 RepID=UPI0008C8CBA4|nr:MULTISPECIES: S8 family peptidase [unclassified Luteibacter]SEO85465.1 Serine protease, subtilisin family [Luteibacter sp. UNC138MFCol5.1]SEW02326.1 Serine protease, subtilisin family [Luteibacter sp. 329MFSha]